jgi:tetratricopeptide (TPR) repeat protein
MANNPRKGVARLLSVSLLWISASLAAQKADSTAGATSTTRSTPEKAIALAEHGRCKEALPGLKRAMTAPADAETRKKVGVLGLRCALGADDRDAAVAFTEQLQKQFPLDPDILFVLVHAYSDLSTRTAQDLGRTAPQSLPAHKLNAEAMEMQGKWDEAEREYEDMIAKNPNTPGLHYLLGRLLLSRPDVDAKATERAKQEFQKEVEIDPNNAGAEYVLGQLASKDENWDEAIARFSAAAKLDPNFAEAYLSWGYCLVTVKRYQEGIAPLRVAERLTPGNPAVHYALATALSRSGHKEEAEKEFEIHRSLTAPAPNAPGGEKPQ